MLRTLVLSCVLVVSAEAQDLSSLEKRVSALETELRETKLLVDGLIGDTEHIDVPFDPNKRSFQRVDSNTGFFLVKINDVVPYLEGYKVMFSIGNPMNVTFDGFTMKLRWGRKEPKDGKKFSEFWGSLKTSEIPFSQSLYPSRWNQVEAIVSPASAETFVRLFVSIETIAVVLDGR